MYIMGTLEGEGRACSIICIYIYIYKYFCLEKKFAFTSRSKPGGCSAESLRCCYSTPAYYMR